MYFINKLQFYERNLTEIDAVKIQHNNLRKHATCLETLCNRAIKGAFSELKKKKKVEALLRMYEAISFIATALFLL